MKHARLSPSSSARWLTCTASVEASDKYENKGNSAATWGTNVHYLGEQLLIGNEIAVGQQHVEQGVTFTIDAEMLKTAEEYADYVRSFVNKDSVTLIEEQFDLSCISPNQFGTSDATVLNGTHLHVFDLKTGHGIVNAENNTQMMLYAIGAVEELESIYDIDEITLHIVQTRAGHIDSWNLHHQDLMVFKTYAQQQARKIVEGYNITFNPTKKGCQWCAHATNCDALKSHVTDTVTGAFDDLDEIEGQADKVDTTHIKNILDNADLIIGFIKAIQDVALEKMQEGVEIDGYKIIRTRKNKKWANLDDAEKYLVRKLKQTGAFKKTLITPTQAIKAVGKENAGHLEKLFTVPEGDLKVVSNDTKGEAVTIVVDQFKELT